ncbi:MAG: hypothetical protein LBP54_03550 [Campylobacteraceae bacterium]|jgi:hypothetical protein|nr:hypothetical protein [Campylobacteraceae bacterium]
MLKKVSIILVLVIAALGVFLFQSGKIYSLFQKDIVFYNAKSECDLHASTCEVVLEDKKITLDIDKPIKAGEEMTFNIQTDGFEDDELLAQIYGINMNMGIFEYILKKTDNKNYQGKALVPACMMGKMSWQVNIISKRENIGASFVLELL